ncbi:MAG: iron ABC transporter permease [Dysgonamonadaceae bacterium]|jgi:iron complex transport system permease protein|nr:iron ABC transporter permease [Dysgonamonadaceae bacterium]
MRSKRIIGYGIVPAIVILFLCNLFYGTVSIPAPAVMDILLGKAPGPEAWQHIILLSRLPQALTALLAGAALAVSGLMLQTLFRNPLAGPSILGISDGANFGVAVVMLWTGATASINLSTVAAAFIGALAVLGLILYFSTQVRNNVLVLIIGMMIGYLASSGISILHSFATSESIRSYVLWGMGSFSNVSYRQIPFYSGAVLVGLTGAVLLIKPLNILLLGENYATNLGVRVLRIRIFILLVTGFLTAVVTAFCGPVGFIGLAVPHIARLVLRTSNQQYLLPATLLAGAAVALFCNLLTIIPFGNSLLPLNAVTPLLGAPVILYVILNRRNAGYFY